MDVLINPDYWVAIKRNLRRLSDDAIIGSIDAEELLHRLRNLTHNVAMLVENAEMRVSRET